MIITDIRINNLYCFDDFYVDFSYPRKVNSSTIDYEFLEERPSFNIKRFCVIMGTNSSGKTSFGKVLCGIENFIVKKEITDLLKKGICDKDKSASFEVKFVTPSDLKFHSLSLEFNAETAFPIKGLTYKSIPILQNDSCLSCRKKIDSIKSNVKNKNYTFISANDNSNLIEKFDAFKNVQFNDTHWAYSFYLNDSKEINLHNGNNPISKDILEKVLKTFDPSIKGIDALTKNSTSKDAGYLVEFVNGDEVQLNSEGKVVSPNIDRLSKGTFDALSVMGFIANVMTNTNSKESYTYYLDEKLSSSHSEIEIDLLNLVVSKLAKNSQFIYTTHNNEVLNLNIPSHSFLFLSKKGNYVEAFQPEKMSFNKNDRTLFSYVKNNMFGTVPDTDYITQLLLDDFNERN